MTDSLTSWPDTTETEPPTNRWHAAAWLLGRHPDVARLVTRVPNVVGRDLDGQGGGLDISVEILAETFADLDAFRVAWHDYQAAHPAPEDDRAYDTWEAAGPKPTPAARSISVMSGGEVRTLRLLAFLADSMGVRLHLPDTQGLLGGQEFLVDWCRAILAAN